MVDGVGLGEDELADGHHGVAVVDETGEDGGQGLRRVQRGVVEQHDAALPHPAGHPLADGIRVVASWGNMIAAGKDFMAVAPWTVIVPGVALMMAVMGFNFLGDGLRDVLDPKQTR